MTETFTTLDVDRVGTGGRVVRITLNRPEVLNAISSTMVYELHALLRAIEADHSARVIILRGAGRAFCAGYDISGDGSSRDSALSPGSEFEHHDESGRVRTANVALAIRQTADLQMYLFRIGKVTIAQTHGYCIAGGMELAMMADLVTTSTNCQFGHPGHRGVGVARNGMILPLVIGMRKAKELFYTGDSVDGTEAESLGLVNYAWPEGELDARTLALADRVAHNSSDMLSLLKAGMNRFYENMGLHASVEALTLMDASAQQTDAAYEWHDRVKADGVREALAWRDGRYADYGMRPK